MASNPLGEGNSLFIDTSGKPQVVPQEATIGARDSGYIPASPDQVNDYVKQQSYQTPTQILATFGEGAAKALTFGTSPLLENALGVSDEDMNARARLNPIAHGAGTVAGIAAPLALGPVGALTAPGLISRAGAAARGAAEAALPAAESTLGRIAAQALATGAGSAVEGAAYAGSYVVSEAALGDPRLTAESAAAQVATGALLGLGVGVGGSMAWNVGKEVLTDSPLSRKAREWLIPREANLTVQSLKAEKGVVENLEASNSDWNKLLHEGREDGVIGVLSTPKKTFESSVGAIQKNMGAQDAFAQGVDSATKPEELADLHKMISDSRFGVGSKLPKSDRVTFDGKLDDIESRFSNMDSKARYSDLVGLERELFQDADNAMIAAGHASDPLAQAYQEFRQNVQYAMGDMAVNLENASPGMPTIAAQLMRKIDAARAYKALSESGLAQQAVVGTDGSGASLRHFLVGAALGTAKGVMGGHLGPLMPMLYGFASKQGWKYLSEYMPGIEASLAGKAIDVMGGLPALSGEAAGMLASQIGVNRGATYQPLSGEQPSSGFAVSSPPAMGSVFSQPPSKEIISNYAAKYGRIFNQDPNAFLGAWEDSGKWYLDISHVLSDRANALALGMKNHQKAIYDLLNHESISIPEALAAQIGQAVKQMPQELTHENPFYAIGAMLSGEAGAATAAGEQHFAEGGEVQPQPWSDALVKDSGQDGALSTLVNNTSAGIQAERLSKQPPTMGPGATAIADTPEKIALLSHLERTQLEVADKVRRGAKAVVNGIDDPSGNSLGTGPNLPSDSDKALKQFTKRASGVRALVSNQNLMSTLLQNQSWDWSDHAPQTAQAMQQFTTNAVQYLNSKLPPFQSQGALEAPVEPSQMDISHFNRIWNAVDNPLLLLKQAAAGTIMPETVDAVRIVYPALFQQMQSAILGAISDHRGQLRYSQRLAISDIMGQPMDGSLKLNAFGSNQALYQQGEAQGMQGSQSKQPVKANAKMTLPQRTKTDSQSVAARGEEERK